MYPSNSGTDYEFTSHWCVIRGSVQTRLRPGLLDCDAKSFHRGNQKIVSVALERTGIGFERNVGRDSAFIQRGPVGETVGPSGKADRDASRQAQHPWVATRAARAVAHSRDIRALLHHRYERFVAASALPADKQEHRTVVPPEFAGISVPRNGAPYLQSNRRHPDSDQVAQGFSPFWSIFTLASQRVRRSSISLSNRARSAASAFLRRF